MRTMGRATQGVRLINLRANDSIASVARVASSSDEDVASLQTDTPEAIEPDSQE
jgi:DNA gyrase subunit A